MPRVTLMQGDITTQVADAIVNAANDLFAGGGGVDGAIHRAGGPSIMDECASIGGCPTGEARATGAGALPARYVIHAVGPVWHGGRMGEDELLASAHRRAFAVAADLGCRTVAVPAISTGSYGFPVTRAAPIALREAHAAPSALEEVRFVLFSEGHLLAFERAAESLA